MPTFLERFDRAIELTRSLVCVGLDVYPDLLPVSDAGEFNRAIVDATADLACAYKPNLAYYEAMGAAGLEALQRTVEHIRSRAPDALLIGDAKRGDMGGSSEGYAKAMFQVWQFDAVTINPWGGRDSVLPFLEDPARGAFLWCRGSNPGSADLQDLEVVGRDGNMPLYQHLALSSLEWSAEGNLGLVVGATYPEQLSTVRQCCPGVPFLIPGIGAQGGDLEEAVRRGVDARGRRAVISSSRGIIYASGGPDFAEAARKETARLREAINGILEAGGQGWP